ncbi:MULTISPECIES: hypothetical protein [unclassified Streptomyces]|uniref:hypothetical protein n=1 Tax=unclassified Streptomyces TaxID=2593676 RepID=UPI00081F19A9|nr:MULTISPECIES: hypothetical protein [unclassified Streptomyces]MYR95238.1 hypothetical protein [Streptomyces sp. SID4937]SCD86365.1 hypothetical protein GA0115243_1044157 [Streptomyces sp. ScaeMP-e83]
MKRSDRIRLGGRASTGQTAIEYLALLVVVFAVVGAIVATGIGGAVSRSAHEQVCRIGVAGFGGGDCSDDNDVDEARAETADPLEPSTPLDEGEGEPLGETAGGKPVGKSVALPPGREANALPDLCFEPRESNSSVKVPGSGVLGNTAAWGYSWLVNFVIDKVDNEKNKEKRVKLALDDLAYCLPDYNIVIAQPHEGNLQEMDGTALIETVKISGTTYRVYAFKTGKFTWAEDADLGWKNRAFHGVFDISDDRRTVTFREPPKPKRKEGWKPGDEGCQVEGQEPPDRSRYYNTYSPLDNEGSTQAVRMLVNDMRRCYPDYNVVAMHSEQASHWVQEPDSFVHQGRYRLNSPEYHDDEKGDDISSGRAVFDVYVFDKGTFKNDGDGGYTNWALYGNFTRDGSEVAFEQPEPADLEADSAATGSGTVHFNDETPKYTGGGPYPGTDYSGKVPGDKAELTRSLLDEYGRTFPDKNIITAKSFNDLSFSGVSGLEHLAVVDGVDVFAIDSGTVTNRGDGGWKNWGFTGNFEQAEGAKEVTFSNR